MKELMLSSLLYGLIITAFVFMFLVTAVLFVIFVREQNIYKNKLDKFKLREVDKYKD